MGIERIIDNTVHEEDSEEEVYEQYTKMQKESIPKILEILQEEEYNIAIVCNGLISVVRALINMYGNDDLREECVHYLSEDLKNVKEMMMDQSRHMKNRVRQFYYVKKEDIEKTEEFKLEVNGSQDISALIMDQYNA